jgi:hypothetical protein
MAQRWQNQPAILEQSKKRGGGLRKERNVEDFLPSQMR